MLPLSGSCRVGEFTLEGRESPFTAVADFVYVA